MSARNETPHVINQTLGVAKCNGSWEASTENLTMDQVKEIAWSPNITHPPFPIQ